MGYANDGLRFMLELGALAALGYWASPSSTALRSGCSDLGLR